MRLPGPDVLDLWITPIRCVSFNSMDLLGVPRVSSNLMPAHSLTSLNQACALEIGLFASLNTISSMAATIATGRTRAWLDGLISTVANPMLASSIAFFNEAARCICFASSTSPANSRYMNVL